MILIEPNPDTIVPARLPPDVMEETVVVFLGGLTRCRLEKFRDR